MSQRRHIAHIQIIMQIIMLSLLYPPSLVSEAQLYHVVVEFYHLFAMRLWSAELCAGAQ